jgi:hypothetical protein
MFWWLKEVSHKSLEATKTKNKYKYLSFPSRAFTMGSKVNCFLITRPKSISMLCILANKKHNFLLYEQTTFSIQKERELREIIEKRI